jgi:nucleoside diphosphate kinase
MRKYAFVAIKPDSVDSVIDVNILGEMENHGIQILTRKFTVLSDDYVDKIYPEKKDKVYLDELKRFLGSGQSLCLIVKATDNEDIELMIRNFKEYIRKKYAVTKHVLSDEERPLYENGLHPMQSEITEKLAFRNVIHSTSDPVIVQSSIKKIFSESEMLELREQFPDLYDFWRNVELHSELVPAPEHKMKIR